MKFKFSMRKAFTMMELVFVIVIIGIVSKFGVDLLSESYKSFIFSKLNNSLQSQSATAVEYVAAKVQYRIKDSIIARKDKTGYTALAEVDSPDYKVLEWVGSDMEGFRGLSDDNSTHADGLTYNMPNWSGIIDLIDGNATRLVSPETNTTKVNKLINILSYGDSSISDAALYFIGSNSDIDGYGWDGGEILDQNKTMHPINSGTNINEFIPAVGDFIGIDVFEYYKLAWSAYAIVHSDIDGNLTLHYDYQPWNGQNYLDDGKKALIMQNVSTFKFMSVGSLVKVQICVKTDIMKEEYSICKEKTIY